ncbi:MAG: hypothetical protein KI790_18030 [Cyclobacteriaceae bacterium]|nr:hypothetical protein [Cyclobacteriaceae bacterium HetDA_MAG_MS6]
MISQDDYPSDASHIPSIQDRVDWEHPSSINHLAVLEAVRDAYSNHTHVIVDGLFAFYDPLLDRLYDKRIYLTIDKNVFLERKSVDERWGNEPDWFIEHIWSSHKQHGMPTSNQHLIVHNYNSSQDQAVFKYLSKI